MARDLCGKHYQRWKTYGDPAHTQKREISRLMVAGGTARVELTQGKWAVFDAADVAKVQGFTWQAAKRRDRWYAGAHVPGGGRDTAKVWMHQLLCSDDAPEVDHIDGDGLNNRRSNLRGASRLQNAVNSSSHQGSSSVYKGVSWDAPRRRWKAQITRQGRNTFIGRYITEEDAARAYDALAGKEWGGFARLNFPASLNARSARRDG